MDGAALTHDRFLNGRLRIWQPRQGYRAATDPVFLAAAVPARAGERVLELGCGVGAATLCLATRVPGLALTGLERQPAYAELARRNAAEAGMAVDVVTGDLTDMPPTIRAQSFDHVMMNPPYYATRDFSAPRDSGKDTAHREVAGTLADWVTAGRKRLRPGGRLTIIQQADRLDDMLMAFGRQFGDVMIRPLAPRAGRPAGRVLVTALKGRSGPLRLLAPLVLHDGPRHEQDGDDSSAAARAILRDGAALGWGDLSAG
ncbi:tRNA1(Val) (adenine(37)-N6)-methyltransferase [Oceanomicrobium pacificus]|uniref:Methyltransferase n=1 Tax=Oceanomicrobium pacificus TaxID=2692916 RepID=A0A6B0TSN8_9RHOB|nr:methyltransferase [Oceanomicrobium pacificus]MXU64003.1 methyltransferase [Oceanomicrobium pacificus]